MASVTEYLHPKDLARLANHQVLAKRVVEGFAPACIAPRTKASVWSSSNTANMFPGMRFDTLTGRSLGKAIVTTYGNMKRRPISVVTSCLMQAVPWLTGNPIRKPIQAALRFAACGVPVLHDAEADR